ncbi:site-specific integrase [Clostridium bowmanii]|uniref:tyrosine-type recombinase/integrase n=1 Tax=Clostridium bowmanii TaxID=132925 RepID=UPI001C0D0C18|nr:site-specific integrase [Clostridium bowmanii]MBU3190761.1 site-specific integrase [Clostridium bowmanii]MCA1074993.1 site-specific integrase [Clostridium bowmanii]
MFLIQEKNEDGCISYIKKYVGLKKENNYDIEIKFSSVTMSENGVDNILLYDLDMNVIRPAYEYLNVKCGNMSINTRYKVTSALRILYSFLKIFNVKLEDIKKDDFSKLKDFLYGDGKKGERFEFEFMTVRSSDTINQYFSVYRNYLNFLGIDNKILNAKAVAQVIKDSDGLLGHTREKATERYIISEKSMQNKLTVPMYIRPNEYLRIISVIQKEYSLREEILVMLMYENGVRLGEGLGLTLEDIEDSKIIIRNRVSDKFDQHAKTCMRPESYLKYKSEAYKKWKVGYQIVKPTYDVLDKIEQYIDIIHGRMGKTNRLNYINFAIADRISDGGTLEGENFYLFLNKNGKPLHAGGWNKVLRVIFTKAGLTIDKDVKKHNLSHRLRHGFAMKRIKEGATQLQLVDDLRHSGPSSVMKYFRATEEDCYNANTLGAKKMITDNPKLEI